MHANKKKKTNFSGTFSATFSGTFSWTRSTWPGAAPKIPKTFSGTFSATFSGTCWTWPGSAPKPPTPSPEPSPEPWLCTKASRDHVQGLLPSLPDPSGTCSAPKPPRLREPSSEPCWRNDQFVVLLVPQFCTVHPCSRHFLLDRCVCDITQASATSAVQFKANHFHILQQWWNMNIITYLTLYKIDKTIQNL